MTTTDALGGGAQDRLREQNELVQAVRDATERFKTSRRRGPRRRLRAQFGCVSGGDFGAMGLHYVNGTARRTAKWTSTHPEIILFEPTPNGGIRITGADFLVLVADWNKTHSAKGRHS